jgi:predicted choloylglycine hydrolase
MQLAFEAIAEPKPGPKWQTVFNRFWPAYQAWFLSRGGGNGPSLSLSVRQLRRFMPELMPTYERLVNLAGGDELAARFLCCYRPPAYLSGCSQAVYASRAESVLIRNYDLAPQMTEGIIFHSAWNGRKVIASNECLWGADDGLNDAGEDGAPKEAVV